MSNYKIGSRQELLQYCFRALGSGALQVNVTEDQAEDRLNDALQMFYEYHFDGSYQKILEYTITSDDITNQYIIVQSGIVSITDVYMMNTIIGGGSSLFDGNLQTYAYFSDLISNIRSGGLDAYVETQSYLSLVNGVLGNVGKITSYNLHENKLWIRMDWSKVKAGDIIGIACYQHDDYDVYGKTYNDYWLKNYTTALIKRQWGQNLIKFSAVGLPGGGQLNGQAILQQANEEIQRLEERLYSEFSNPIDFFMA